MADQPKSRLDREIDEILEKKSREPIAFSSHPRVKKHRGPSQAESTIQKAKSGWQWLVAMPIAMAYLFAIVAFLVRDSSPLLTLLLSTATVAAIWVPGILQFTRSNESKENQVKYWRGQAYTQNIKSAVSRHPLDSLKRYFDRNR